MKLGPEREWIVGRPKKEIDEDEVFLLASYGLTREEIAAVVNCHVNTIDNRFSAIVKEGHTHRNASLRRKQYEVAMHGNVSMLIWLGKQYLGQVEKVEQFGEVTVKEAIESGKRFIAGKLHTRANGHPVATGNVPE